MPRTDGGGTIEVRQLNPPGPWLALLPPPCAHGHQPAAYIRFADATLIAMAITAAGAAPPGWLTADPEPAPSATTTRSYPPPNKRPTWEMLHPHRLVIGRTRSSQSITFRNPFSSYSYPKGAIGPRTGPATGRIGG